MKKLEERPWWPELVSLKDALSLRELAERYSVAPAAISNAIKRTGLTRVSAPPGPRDKRPEALKAAAASAVKAVTAPARTTAKVATQAAPSPGSAPASDDTVWKVGFGHPQNGDTFIVGSLADVSQRLAGKDVLSLTREGRALST